MSITSNVAESLTRLAGALRTTLAGLPLALWLGAPRHGARDGAEPVFIHIDEWGRITRLRRQR
jgi:hypothetical protein